MPQPRSNLPEATAARIRVGWAGHPGNLAYLEAIEPALMTLRAQDARGECVVFSGARPRFRELPYDFIEYRPGAESSVIRAFDIGLLPLPENDFANGKSPIKGLQYMASAVPRVASPTASVREMFGENETGFLARTPADWAAALLQLVQDSALRTAVGSRARAEFENRYKLRRAAVALAELIANPKSAGSPRHGGPARLTDSTRSRSRGIDRSA